LHIGEIFKLKPAIPLNCDLNGSMDNILVSLESSRPAADKALSILAEIKRAAQVANLELVFLKRS